MNPLVLSGWNIKVKTANLKSESALELWSGHENTTMPTRMRFRPRKLPYDSVILDGYSGYVSLRALHWLSRNGTPIYVLDVDGSLLSTILPASPLKADLRVAQIHAADDPEKRLTVAKALIQAKIQRSLEVLQWIGESYDVERELRAARLEASRVGSARTLRDLLVTEARTAQYYWQVYCNVLPSYLEFEGRMTARHNNNASDPVNSGLNYGYAILEGECRRAINAVGLDAGVGFLHDFSATQTRESLVYDLMEPYRFLVDLSVLQGFESRVLDLHTFHFRFDDYRFRFNPDAKDQFITLLKEQFNRGARYKARGMLGWDTVILEKAKELARYLTGKSKKLNFIEPSPSLERSDGRELRAKILSLSSVEAKRLGIGKSELHYLRRSARAQRSFKLYQQTRQRLLT